MTLWAEKKQSVIKATLSTGLAELGKPGKL